MSWKDIVVDGIVISVLLYVFCFQSWLIVIPGFLLAGIIDYYRENQKLDEMGSDW